jgi:Flp pilus assembly protein TadD
MAYNLAGSNDLAESSLREALRLSPTNAAANLNLGLLCSELERFSEAEKAFRVALKSDPKSAVAAYNLGVLLAKSNSDESLRWCRVARDLRPTEPKYAYTLAYFQNAAGQPLDAITTLEKLLEQSPPHADSYALLASLYSNQNKSSDALKTLQRARDNVRLSTQERARFSAQIQRLTSPVGTP